MIEPVTLFSAIAGVTNLASRLTIDLTRLTIAIKNVPDQITQVCNEMVSLNATLTTLQQRFNPMASGYSEEQLLCLETVIASTRETLVQLTKLSDACEVTGKKKAARTGVAGMWKKVNWTFNETEISSYRSGLISYTTMLNLLTATLADQRGANIEAMVIKTNDMLQSLIERKNRLSILSAESTDLDIHQKVLRKTNPSNSGAQLGSGASEFSESRRIIEIPNERSRSVAPSMSRRTSSNGASVEARPTAMSRDSSSRSYTPSHSHSGGRSRSASTSHLPIPNATPPPLPNTGSRLHLDIPPTRSGISNYGLPSPPPEYTEIAPGLYEESPSETQLASPSLRLPSTRPPSSRQPSSRSLSIIPPSSAPRAERQLVRPAQPRVRSRSTNGQVTNTRPTYQRALSSASAAAVEASSRPLAPTASGAKAAFEGHKLEFAGKWHVREIRINNSFMGSGTLHLKKDDKAKRVLVNFRLDSSKDTRLSYRWIESSSATRTKPASMFGGPSYVFQSLVRADDYSGAFSGKTTIKLEDIFYQAGQRSLMIAINLIQQSPSEWLTDTKPREIPVINPFQIESPLSPVASTIPSMARGGFSRNLYTPSTPSLSSYSPSEGTYRDYTPSNYAPSNYSRPSPPQQHAVYVRVLAPPTPPMTPFDSPTGDSRRPSISSSISTSDVRVNRANYDRSLPMPPPIPPKTPVVREVRIRGAERTGDAPGRSGVGSVETTPSSRKERQRQRRGPSSWFSFGRG